MQLDTPLTKQLFPFTRENILEKDERKIKQGSCSMGRSKETFAVGTSRCLLVHSFPLRAPEQPNHRTESLPTPLLRKLRLAAHLVYACGMARAREEGKKFWEETVIKQLQLS